MGGRVGEEGGEGNLLCSPPPHLSSASGPRRAWHTASHPPTDAPTHPPTHLHPPTNPSQEAFKPIVKEARGFEYRAERPKATTFVEQKWAWTGLKPGGWAGGGRVPMGCV